ncbi:ThuA domain-containing protein [Paenibacillus sp. SI8]|uniref:ThuA domain-containing protein n=1 Tax=unclassified Paenibacillus TaxID=185978 RepID=UPI003465DAED
MMSMPLPIVNGVYNPWRNQIRKQALIVQGGYPGHQPRVIAGILARILKEENFEVEIADSLDVFLDVEKLKRMDLIVPDWTAGTITAEQLRNFTDAVQNGTGLAGVHGMGDAFRCEISYQAMVGGQFLAHPGDTGATYRVHIVDPYNPLVVGIGDFTVTTEQWYMMYDPSVQVLAATYFDHVNPPLIWRPVWMPVSWIKMYGKGRVYFNALGHSPDILLLPQVETMVRRGMVWAAR